MKLLVLILGILWCYNSVAAGGPPAAPLEDVSLTISPNEHNGTLIFLGAYVRLEVHGENAHTKRTGPEARSVVGAAPVLTSSQYWMSHELDTIAEAREGCPKQTRGRGTLVKIETPEEDQKVQDFLLAQGSDIIKHPEKFWTDGVCNKYREWKWNSNSALMGEYKNFFNTAGAQSGAIMVFQSTSEVRDDYEWRMEFDRTARHRYICEIEPENVPMQCYDEIDLVIVLDASSSVTNEHYALAKTFVAKLASAFRSPSRVALITYSTDVVVRIGFDKHWTPEQIQSEIMNHKYEEGNTYTGGGIEKAMEQFHTYPRAGVGQRIVVLTDGQSNLPGGDPPGYTARAAAKAKAAGIGMFSVGIGPAAANPEFQKEISKIAGDVNSHKFSVSDFALLINQIRAISITICKNQS